jgi:hypothetical protein
VSGTEIQPPFDINVAVPLNAPNGDALKPTTVGKFAPASRLYVVPETKLKPEALLRVADPSKWVWPVFWTLTVRRAGTPIAMFPKSRVGGDRARLAVVLSGRKSCAEEKKPVLAEQPAARRARPSVRVMRFGKPLASIEGLAGIQVLVVGSKSDGPPGCGHWIPNPVEM